jgi:hypothetical protein
VPGYRWEDPLGVGVHGTVWAGADGDGRPVAVAVVPALAGARGEARSRRLTALSGIEHPHLARVLEVAAVPGGWAVVSERVSGPTLAAVRAAGRPLDVAEARWLLAALAPALARLHERGVVHGDVSPANVVLSPERGPVLVDLLADPAGEAGTAGFVPPERLAGRAAGPTADVWALTATARWAVAAEHRDTFVAAFAGALAEDPGGRWDAAALASAAQDGEARPAGLPDAAALAHGTLRAAATIAPTARAVGRRRRGPVGTRRRGGARRAGVPRRGGAGPAGVRGRRGVRGVRGAALLLAGVVAALVLGFQLRPPGERAEPARETRTVAVGAPVGGAPPGGAEALPRGSVEGAPAAGPSRIGGPETPEDAVVALLAARDAAFTAGDAAWIRSLTVPGSPAARSDEASARFLERSVVRVAGLSTLVHSVRALVVGEGEARVEVVTSQSAHERTVGAGAPRRLPAGPRVCAVLVVDGRDGWRVRAVEPCGPQRVSQAEADSMVG